MAAAQRNVATFPSKSPVRQELEVEANWISGRCMALEPAFDLLFETMEQVQEKLGDGNKYLVDRLRYLATDIQRTNMLNEETAEKIHEVCAKL